MKLGHWIVVAGALASALPAQAATTDPVTLVYRASGAINNPSINSNLGTTVFCSSFSTVTESIEIVVRADNGVIFINSTQNVEPFGLLTELTPNLSNVNFFGTLSIGSTTASVSCTVLATYSINNVLVTVPLHLQRYNPIPNTSE
jgi:hypothetical protein